MSPINYVNEHFFDRESKAMWYVLGISYSRYSRAHYSHNSFSNSWQSTNESLMEIVKSSLESEHAIRSTQYRNIRGDGEFTSYIFRVYNRELFDSLETRGLGVPKTKRSFPKNIGEQYLDHFVRGLFDAQVSCRDVTIKGRTESSRSSVGQRLRIGYNVPFLCELYKSLVKHAHIKDGRTIDQSHLELATADTRAVYNFIYRDWDFIQENGLYSLSKKELFDRTSTDDLLKGHDYSQYPQKIRVQNRIARAKELLLVGMSGEKVAKTLEYLGPVSFFRAFKNETGQTTRQFLKESQQTLAS